MKKVELTEGKRYLVSSRFKMGMGIDSIVECEIIEISPSKQYIKIKFGGGIGYWSRLKKFNEEYEVIEELRNE